MSGAGRGHRNRSAASVLLVLAALLGLSAAGCAGPAVTDQRLAASVGLSFQRLYVRQQNELGHDVARPDRAATCLRTGSSALTGAGNWACTVHFPFPDGHVEPATFDVDVTPVGCYTATGPPSVTGALTLTTPAGTSVTNPLYAFDGCFPTR